MTTARRKTREVPKDTRKGIQSVEIGLRVAAALASFDGPMPLKDVARASGLTGSATHRYLVSLARAGLAEQTGDGRYDLGGFALRMGFAALSRIDAVAVAEQHLRAFVDQSGTTAMLSVWSERGPIVIRWMQGRRAVYTTISIGSLMSIETSATGATFLAWLDTTERDRALASLPAKRRSQLVKHAAEVRRTGYAQVEGDFVPGLYAMAVPVVSGPGDLVATFTAVTAGETISVETRKALQQAAAAAGAALGQRITEAAS